MTFFGNHRFAGFFLIHALICAAVCAYYFLVQAPVQGPPFEPVTIGFVQTFFGSLAGAILSIVQLVIGEFKGFSGAGQLPFHAFPVPMPIIAGAATVLGLAFLWAAANAFSTKAAYFLFILCSCLFLYSAFIYFSDSANAGKAMIGHPAILQLGK